jgi:tetratricopeptide (TPR) repeat protein
MDMTQVTSEQAIQIALRHYESGQLQQSEAICRQLLALDPNQADALHLLGLIAHRVNHPDAAALIRRALALQPRNAIAYGNLALVLQNHGKWDEAMECSRQALALQPNVPEAHYNLGYAFHLKGDLEEAVSCYRRSLAINPQFTPPYQNLGAALKTMGRVDEAIQVYRQGLKLQPASAALLSNLGDALWEQGKADESAQCCRQAMALDPNFPEPHLNLGNTLVMQNRFEEAIECYRRAIALRPDYALAHCNVAMALLTIGQFEEGWREHEWRWRKPGFPSVARNFSQPQWDGSELNGRTVLLHSEQGLGDALQFVRFANHVQRRGGRAVIECKPALLRLFQNAAHLGADAVVVQNEAGAPPPVAFDLHLPLLSLPLALGIFDPAKIPTPVPYLQADPLSEEHWRQLLTNDQKRLKVGLAWVGSAVHVDDKVRSISLDTLGPLAREDVAFYSLQVGRGSEQAAKPPNRMELIDFTARLADFADTAGLVSQLDLVICVDTSIAHLAGAMGKPVWVMIPHRPDFRWMLDREDTPWYPTMRLFRQQTPGNWREVVERIGEALDSAVHTPLVPREN